MSCTNLRTIDKYMCVQEREGYIFFVCVCVCARERDRERERVLCVHIQLLYEDRTVGVIL